MEKLRLLMVLTVCSGLLAQPAPAAAQAFSAYITGTQVMNLSDSQATVIMRYYHADDNTPAAGDLVDSVMDTIDAFSSKTYFTATPAFKGSVMISSDQPLAAISNIQNETATASAAYVGADALGNGVGLPLVLAPAPIEEMRSDASATAVGSPSELDSLLVDDFSISLPLLMKGNGSVPYTTWFSVQNLGTAEANIRVEHNDPGCIVLAAKVKPNASRQFYQADEDCITQKVLSATVRSDQPLAVVVMEENRDKLLAYSGFPAQAAAANLVMPLINFNGSGLVTGVQIQNTSDTDSDVTVTYIPSIAGTGCTETQNIPANSSKTFALIAFNVANSAGVITNCTPGQRFVGSAQVTGNSANAPLVGIVNQTKSTYGEAYGAFNPANGTPRVVMPLLMDRNGRNNYVTGFSLMNVGNTPVYVQCVLTGAAAANYQPAALLQPGAALTPNQAYQIGPGYVGSGTCTAYLDAAHSTIDDNARIVAVVNEIGNASADRLLVYEGINIQP